MLRVVATLVPVLSIVAGCSSGGSTAEEVPLAAALLHEVGDLLRASGDGRGPAKVNDLAKAGEFYNRGFDAVKSGAVVVVWGAKMAGEGEIEAGTAPKGVIAYEKAMPTRGGYALLQDGTVLEMTADEFKSAPKAN